MTYSVVKVSESEFPELVDVWEASVRATHHFLKEEDINFFKPLILNAYLKLVELVCVKNEHGAILGFLGTAGDKIEMLFVAPEMTGKGIGKALMIYALEEVVVKKVDVNEANEEAIKFYQHFGFNIVARSPLDSTGKPYPILHMELT